MSFADEMWLSATAAQRNAQHVLSYSAAFLGTAAVQSWKMGVEAPMAFWQAVARVGGMPVAGFRPRIDAEPATASAPIPAPEPEPMAEAAPEPVTAPAPEPMAEAAPGPSPHLLDAPRGGQADDLTIMSGVGEKLAAALGEFGIYHFDQIAALDEAGIDWLNEQQPGFKALAKRFDLVGQARGLAG